MVTKADRREKMSYRNGYKQGLLDVFEFIRTCCFANVRHPGVAPVGIDVDKLNSAWKEAKKTGELPKSEDEVNT
jgi:hypothetical protein